MIYLLLVNITLLLCYLLYFLFFRRLTFFQLNRIYLVGSVVLSIMIPIGLFIDISAFGFVEDTIPSIDLATILVDEFLMEVTPTANLSLAEVCRQLYWAGVWIALAWLSFRLLYTLYLLRNKKSNFSFSFFHYIVLGEKNKVNQVIKQHEQVHVKQGHSYDILLLELFKAFNWFNPIGYCYLKELKFQHECIADELCAENKIAYAELLVAQAMDVDTICFAHEFSKKSILKNRIMMLFKDKSKNRSKLRYFSFIPVAMLALFSTLVFNSSKAQTLVQDFEAKLEETSLKAVLAEKLSDAKQGEVFSAKTVEHNGNQKLNNNDFVAVATERVEVSTVRPDTAHRVLTLVEANKVFAALETKPEPVEGFDIFRKWVAQNYNYPQAAIDAGVKGQIVISFIVEKDGTLSSFNIVNDLGHGTGAALIETLREAQKWKPGLHNGKPARVMFNLPMTLDLSA